MENDGDREAHKVRRLGRADAWQRRQAVEPVALVSADRHQKDGMDGELEAGWDGRLLVEDQNIIGLYYREGLCTVYGILAREGSCGVTFHARQAPHCSMARSYRRTRAGAPRILIGVWAAE